MTDEPNVVKGFKGAAVAAGFKAGGRRDLGLILSETGAAAAGVFTTNRVKAAPVILTQAHIQKGPVRAVVANSGNANACTGEAGLADARRTAALAAAELGIAPEEVLIASTGVIGARLDMGAMAAAIPSVAAGLASEGLPRVAEAIMTTDSFPKLSRFEGRAGGKDYRIVGIAKGAGMIMPDMATMLCFVLSDLRIGREELQQALSSCVERTFNRITVDGDTSTNDTVLVLANGTARNDPLTGAEYEAFQGGLGRVMGDLAAMIVQDGEGATKLVRVRVRGAATPADALVAARTIANSSLVKTAFYGEDANWGRILAALGRSGAAMREERVDIWIEDVWIVAGGLGVGSEAEKRAAERMRDKAFSLHVDLGQGPYEDQMLTCDLTHDYIKINAEYRT